MKQTQSQHQFDFKKIDFGKKYSDTYGQFLSFFERISQGDRAYNVPRCWVPLIFFLGAKVESSIVHFGADKFLPDHKAMVKMLNDEQSQGDLRHIVEMFCSARPELTDALWKVDFQWKKTTVAYKEPKEMLITNYNSFWRKEIHRFIKLVSSYRTKHDKCVITNCSADKPYPGFVHKTLKELYPDHELLVISGVTGIVPELFFKIMPNYDSGIPNFWNIKKLSAEYFINNRYKEIVVFTEFNQYALNETLFQICPDAKIEFKFPHEHRTDYTIDDNYMRAYKNLKFEHE